MRQIIGAAAGAALAMALVLAFGAESLLAVFWTGVIGSMTGAVVAEVLENGDE